MVLILGFLGLLAAIWTWNNVHPLAGVVVGFLFVGGAGWQLLFAGLRSLTPTGRRAFGPEGKQFIQAWESRVSVMRPGRADTQPPPGLFDRWLSEYKRTGISAGDWLDQRLP